MTEVDLMTPLERKRKERNETIIREFKELAPRFQAQGVKPFRIFRALAEKHEITPEGVRFILRKAGVYGAANK